MGQCSFSFDRIEILNQKSDTKHSDNDWLSMVWSINDQVYSKTIPLVTAAGSQVIHSGDVLQPFQDYVVCENQDTVIMVYTIVNLGSYDWGKQAEAAAQVTKQILDEVLPIYLEAAKIVLAAISEGVFPGVPDAIMKLAGQTDGIFSQLSNSIGGLIDSAFDKVITPALKGIAEVIAELVTGRPNCNGEVLHDYVIYLPFQPVKDIHISKPYTGPQTNSSCGHAPSTKIDLTMHRTGIQDPQADWRLCQQCGVMFFAGFGGSGPCPGSKAHKLKGTGAGHQPQTPGNNYLLTHDNSGPGEQNWRRCVNCMALFYDGDALSKGVCPAAGPHILKGTGAGHLAAGFNIDLPFSAPAPGQNGWRKCGKCWALFHSGTDMGVCPVGDGAHVVVPHPHDYIANFK